MPATSRQITCSLLFQQEGLSAEGAAAMVGNFSQESGRNLPTAFRTANLDHGSNGLGQWRLERLTNYENMIKRANPNASSAQLWQLYGDMASQVKFAVWELQHQYPTLYAKLTGGQHTVTELANDVCWEYERPNRAESGITNRVNQALATYASAPKAGSKEAVQVLLTNKALAHGKAAKSSAATSVMGVAGLAATGHHMVSTGAPWWAWVIFGLASVIVGVVLAAVGVALHDKQVTEAALASSKAAVPTAAAPTGGA